MNLTLTKFYITFLACLSLTLSYGQTDTSVSALSSGNRQISDFSDRVSLTPSTQTVGKGLFQFSIGTSYLTVKEDVYIPGFSYPGGYNPPQDFEYKSNTLGFPFKVGLGITKRSEFWLGLGMVNTKYVYDGAFDGSNSFNLFQLGFKYWIVGDANTKFNLGTSLYFNSGSLRDDFGVNLMGEYELINNLNLRGELFYVFSDNNWYHEFIERVPFSVSVIYSFEKFGLSLGYLNMSKLSGLRNKDYFGWNPTNSYSAGIFWNLSNQFLLDFEYVNGSFRHFYFEKDVREHEFNLGISFVPGKKNKK